MRNRSSHQVENTPPDAIGRYALLRPIGAGGMASVFLAHDPVFSQPVALKLIHAHLCEEPAMRERFRREVVTLSILKHPAVVPVHDSGEADGRPYLAMRHMEGGSLQRRLGGGPLPPREAAAILLRIAPALDAAHAMGIVHRDVKPGNILFDREGRAYLSDFGLVRLLGSGSEITRHEFFGTPAYAAPEQAGGRDDVDGRADVYALATVLYRMLVGALPFDAPSPHEVLRRQREDPAPRLRERLPGAPAALQTALDRAMAKRPEDRYPTAAAFAQAAAQALEDGGGMVSAAGSAPAPIPLPSDRIPATEQATRVDSDPSSPRRAAAEETLSERSMRLAVDPARFFTPLFSPDRDAPLRGAPREEPRAERSARGKYDPPARPAIPRWLRTGLLWLLGAAALAGLLALAYREIR